MACNFPPQMEGLPLPSYFQGESSFFDPVQPQASILLLAVVFGIIGLATMFLMRKDRDWATRPGDSTWRPPDKAKIWGPRRSVCGWFEDVLRWERLREDETRGL